MSIIQRELNNSQVNSDLIRVVEFSEKLLETLTEKTFLSKKKYQRNSNKTIKVRDPNLCMKKSNLLLSDVNSPISMAFFTLLLYLHILI